MVLLAASINTDITPTASADTMPSKPAVSPTPEAYPPQKPYDDRDVILSVKQIDSNTIYIINNGGSDSPSLKKIWVNMNTGGYVKPSSGDVTSQTGSYAYYKIPNNSVITITGEFDDCNAILWRGMSSTATVKPTLSPTVRPTLSLTANPTQKPSSGTTSSNDYYVRSYKWSFKKSIYTWELSIPKTAYEYYKAQPHNRESDYAMYAMSDYDRPYLKSLATEIKNAASRDGYSEQDAALMTIAFVQSLPYTSDSVTTGYDEYPRYPLETLVDNGGDCEDTSILTAALIKEMGYGVVLLEFPRHMAVGIKGSDNYPGTYWEYMGSKYFYLETTGDNWNVGQVPGEYQQAKAIIYPMQQIPKIDLNFNTSYVDSDYSSIYYRVHCDYKNIGTGTAKNVSIYFAALALSEGSGQVWSPDQNVNIGDCVEGGSGWAEATLRIPLNKQSQIECVAYGDNFEPTISKSNIFDT